MRLAIVRQRYTPYGGAERFIERTLPALERAGAEVTLIARSVEGWKLQEVAFEEKTFKPIPVSHVDLHAFDPHPLEAATERTSAA